MAYRLLALCAIVLLAWGGRPARAAPPQCFQQTGECLEGRFLEFWQDNGGLMIFGYPLTPPAPRELNRDSGTLHPTQWLERHRFEAHPENAAPYDVLLGRLGDQRLRQLGIDWRDEPQAAGPAPGCLWFAETRHNLCDQSAGRGFKQYWQSHGLEFDGVAGTSYAESLALFGMPLTEPRLETNASGDTVLTQWFERARFELHNPQQPEVLLGLLASEILIHQPAPGFNGQIAYRQEAAGGTILAVATANGARNLILGENLRIQNLAWSPDGRSIALRHLRGDRQELTLIEVATGRQTPLATLRAPWGAPSWSPDSRQVAFDDAYAINTVSASGGEPRALPTGHEVIAASWSPDGRRIAFNSWQSFSAGTTNIGVVNPADGSARLIRRLAAHVAWSPDGSRMLALESPYPNLDHPDRSLFVIDADGGRETPLLAAQDWTYLAAAWRNAAELVIAYATDQRAGACETRVINLDSGEQRAGPAIDPCPSQASWSPDGRFLAFSLGGTITAVPLGEGPAIALDIRGAAPHWGPPPAPRSR